MLIRPVHREWELIKWMVAIAVAVALTLLWANAVGAADVPAIRATANLAD